MNTLRPTGPASFNSARQQGGVVLFIALVALVTIMLAAIALMRSVDTSTIIAGNIAFKQSAATSGDGGVTAAVNWMKAIAAANPGVDPSITPTHPFNADDPVNGYYSALHDTTSNFATLSTTWVNGSSVAVNGGNPDMAGNSMRYIIERMCNVGTAGQALSTANCLFSNAAQGGGSDVAGEAAPFTGGLSPINRITIQIKARKNSTSYSTTSYIQAFVF